LSLKLLADVGSQCFHVVPIGDFVLVTTGGIACRLLDVFQLQQFIDISVQLGFANPQGLPYIPQDKVFLIGVFLYRCCFSCS
jgi:hypothetical protein